MSWKKQQEDDIHQAKILNALMKKMTNNFQNVTKYAADMAVAMKKSTDSVTKEKTAWRGKEKHDRWKNQYLEKQQKFEDNMYDKKVSDAAKQSKIWVQERADNRKHNKAIADDRNRNRIMTEQVHGDNVRHNLKMRQLYKDQGQSLSNVMNLMTGMSGKGAAMGGIKTAFNTLSLSSEILSTNSLLRDAKEKKQIAIGQGVDTDPTQAAEWKKIIDRVVRLEEIKIEQTKKLGMFGRLGGGDEDEKNESKWAKRLEHITAWAKKNKTGIIISAASIGLMFMVFKKLISVSPMLQRMLEIMGLAFNLILRPFGDFIGFILRPIAMAMLAIVMPFFKDVYPVLMELGGTIGEALVNWDLEAVIRAATDVFKPAEIFDAFVSPITGNTPTSAGKAGAGLLTLGATGIGLLAGSILALKSTMGTLGRWAGLGGVNAANVGAPRAGVGSGAPFGQQQSNTGQSRYAKMQQAAAKNAARIAAAAKAASAAGIVGGGVVSNVARTAAHAASVGAGFAGRGVTQAAAAAATKMAASKAALLTAAKAAKLGISAARIGALAAKLSNPVGWAILGWEGVTTAIKHFSPETYQQMRDATEFLGVGREFIGLGEQSTGEMLYGGYNWVKDQVAPQPSIRTPNATFPDDDLTNPNGFNGSITQTPNGGTHITFNIDKVEKGVDVNMIALQVKAILETNDRYVTS